jgi:hypothetical protein
MFFFFSPFTTSNELRLFFPRKWEETNYLGTFLVLFSEKRELLNIKNMFNLIIGIIFKRKVQQTQYTLQIS